MLSPSYFSSFLLLVSICMIEMETAGQCPGKKVSLPEATVTRIIKEMLPPDVQVDKEVQGLLRECCDEFINLISSESNEIGIKEGKGLITSQRVLKALEDLGFGEYIGEVQAACEQHETKMQKRKEVKAGKVKFGGMTEEGATAAQQKLFAEARARMNYSSGAPATATQATNSDDEEVDEDSEATESD